MNKKYLRKEDIKSGMLVEYCGELCLVVGSTSGLCLCGVDHWCPVDYRLHRPLMQYIEWMAEG